MSQRQDILDLLTERGQAGAYVYELNSAHPHGLGISQYGRCIKELRERGWDIINTEPGHFVLRTDSQLPTYLKSQASKTIVEPQKQEYTWETYQNERGEWVARQVPVKPKQLDFSSLT